MVEMAPKVNQSSADWAPEANPPLMIERVEMAPKVNQSSASWAPKANPPQGPWVAL